MMEYTEQVQQGASEASPPACNIYIDRKPWRFLHSAVSAHVRGKHPNAWGNHYQNACKHACTHTQTLIVLYIIELATLIVVMY